MLVLVGLLVSGCEELEDILADLEAVKGEITADYSDGLEVTEDLDFPTESEDYPDVTIEWSSSNTDVLADDGTVTPALDDTEVTITVTISLGGREMTESFDVIVKGDFDSEHHMSWLESFAKPEIVDGVITLPSTENEFGYVAEFSVDSGLESVYGAIVLPASAYEDGLTFTITLTSREESVTYEYEILPSNQLDDVMNIRFSEDRIAWDAVEGADTYHVLVFKNSETILDVETGEASVEFVGHAGYYDVHVVAKDSTETMKDSGEAMETIAVLSPVETMVLEAEDGALNANMYRGNELASGEAYVGGIDDVGQGVMLMVLVQAEGDYLMDIWYTTGYPPSAHEVFVDGVSQGKVEYTENTGWGDVGSYNPASVQLTVGLDMGYNEIIIQKTASTDNWTELDKIVLTPAEELFYNVDDLSVLDLPVYTLQAEWAQLVGGGINIRANELASNGTYVGGIDNVGDGIIFRFFAIEAGTYTMTIKYTTGVDNPMHEVFVGDTSFGKVTYNQNTGWGGEGHYPNAAVTIEIDLVVGENAIKVLKTGENDQWVELDLVMLELNPTE